MTRAARNRAQPGEAALWLRFVVLGVIAAATLALAGCFGAPLAKPQTFTEQAAYVEAGAQAAIKSLADLTCRKYTAAGTCAEPGRPLHPAASKGYLERISDARKAAKVAVTLPASGGDCLGAPATPQACLDLARALLLEVERVLANAQKKGA